MPFTKLLVITLVGAGAIGVAMSGHLKVLSRGTDTPARYSAHKLGYLSPSELPDVIALLPAPPEPESAKMKQDEAARDAALMLKGSARYALAAADAVRNQQNTVDDFQCAFGMAITTQLTPQLYAMLSRVRLDVRAASYPAKNHFKRQRPFDRHDTHTCSPNEERIARQDFSYPSARGAVGWSYALVLAELRPERAVEILGRGRNFGESRIICDQEWKSDVEAGTIVAAATLNRIRATDQYKADFTAVQKEVAFQLAAGIKPTVNCSAEFAALASH